MTTQEPGGPTNQETASSVFVKELATIKENWGIDAGAVNTSLDKLRETFRKSEDETMIQQLHTRAVQWYSVSRDDYHEEVWPLEHATFHDEPLAMDGKGPWLTGEIVSVTSHDVPGRPGIGWGEVGTEQRSIAPFVPGVMLANTQVQGDDAINEIDLVFVPLLFINEPDIRTLELIGDDLSRSD